MLNPHEAKNRYPVQNTKSTDGRQKWKHYDEVRVSTAAVKSRWRNEEPIADGDQMAWGFIRE
jgi:hypothetical protein